MARLPAFSLFIVAATLKPEFSIFLITAHRTFDGLGSKALLALPRGPVGLGALRVLGIHSFEGRAREQVDITAGFSLARTRGGGLQRARTQLLWDPRS